MDEGLPATARYLRYAVGETLLIVLGVLIAIQVNNWNEERQRRAGQLLIIQDLREAVRLDERLLGVVINNFTRTIRLIDQIETQSRGEEIYPDAASNWVQVVFWAGQTSAVYASYSNNTAQIDDPELSVALNEYMTAGAAIETERNSQLLQSVQEIRSLMDEYIVREYNEGTRQIEPDINVETFLADYQSEADLQEAIYRLYLLSRTYVSRYEFLQQRRAELEAVASRKITELESG